MEWAFVVAVVVDATMKVDHLGRSRGSCRVRSRSW